MPATVAEAFGATNAGDHAIAVGDVRDSLSSGWRSASVIEEVARCRPFARPPWLTEADTTETGRTVKSDFDGP